MSKGIKIKSSKRGANFVEYLVLVAILALAGVAIFGKDGFAGKVQKAAETQGDLIPGAKAAAPH